MISILTSFDAFIHIFNQFPVGPSKTHWLVYQILDNIESNEIIRNISKFTRRAWRHDIARPLARRYKKRNSESGETIGTVHRIQTQFREFQFQFDSHSSRRQVGWSDDWGLTIDVHDVFFPLYPFINLSMLDWGKLKAKRAIHAMAMAMMMMFHE